MREDNIFNVDDKLEEMNYQKFFVRFVRDEGSGVVNVLLDGSHLTWFLSYATTQAVFETDCEDFSQTKKFKESEEKFQQEVYA